LSGDEVDRVKRVIATDLRDTSRVPATIVTDSAGRVLLTRWDAPARSELRKLLWETAVQ